MRRFALTLSLAAAACTHAQFQMQDSTTTASLRGISSPGNGVAWASGTGGTVLRTEDSGFVWQGCATPPGAEKLDFRGVQAFDGQTALVMSSGKGDLSRIYKTTDGCRTWKLVFTNPDAEGFFDAMQFQEQDPSDSEYVPHGWLLGDPVRGQFALWGTFDKGQSWHRLREAGLAEPAGQGGAFAASNSLILADGPSFATAQGWLYGASIDNCTMGIARQDMLRCLPGVHFSKERLPVAQGTLSSGIFSIAHWNDNIVAVGGDYSAPDVATGVAAYRQANPAVAMHGRNKIVTPPHDPRWKSAEIPPRGYRSAVAFDVPSRTFIAVGPNGTDISTNSGRNWSPLRPAKDDQPDADRNWNALALPFVVGPHGRIGRLRDGVLQPPATTKPAR